MEGLIICGNKEGSNGAGAVAVGLVLDV